jgi:hypothetical protein
MTGASTTVDMTVIGFSRRLLVQGEMDWLSCLTPDEQEILIRLLGRIQGHLLTAQPEPAT